MAAGRQEQPPTARVGEPDRRVRRDEKARRLVPDEDADPRLARARERGPRVVVREDPPVVPAVEREPLRAVLAHADAVAEAASDDRERGRGLGGGRERTRDRGSESRHDRARPQARPSSSSRRSFASAQHSSSRHVRHEQVSRNPRGRLRHARRGSCRVMAGVSHGFEGSRHCDGNSVSSSKNPPNMTFKRYSAPP